jgi:uncharacterized protein (DUF302 family)
MTTCVDQMFTAVRRQQELGVPYERFTAALLERIGRTDPDILRELAVAGAPAAEARARLEALAGPSGLSLFQLLDHGALLSVIAGRPTRAATFVIGNALIAIEMTRRDPRVGLYVPLRLFVQELAPDRTITTYEVPSATLAQFADPEISAVAASLDRKLESLIASAVEQAKRTTAA